MMHSRDNPYSPPLSERPASAPADWYGWVHVLLAAAAMIGTLPGRTHGLGLITEPLLADLGLDRTLYASINLWATLLGAALCWPAGVLLDRFGVRPVLAAVSLLLGIVVVTMRFAGEPAELFVLVTLTRALGQSMLSVVSLTLVGKSFRGRLGLAMGVYSLLIGIGFSAAFKGVGAAVLHFGWRDTWSTIGWTLIAVLAPAAWLVRDRRDTPATARAENTSAAADFTVGQALRSQAFWAFAIASSMYGLVSSGIGLFNEGILKERGFAPETYHTVLAISALCGMLANLSSGWAATRMALGHLLAVAMVLMAGSLAALPLVSTAWHVYTYAVVMGAAGGIVTVTFFTVWGAAFGQTHLGKIQAWAQMMTVVASALGPILFALWHKQTGSYAGAFYLLAPLFVGLGLVAWATKLPRQPASSEETEEELQLAPS
ncbi:MAG TPA: MFS transporter [Pirellulales bacterium]|nr:MFS transporter [Pirellulales bacterium]